MNRKTLFATVLVIAVVLATATVTYADSHVNTNLAQTGKIGEIKSGVVGEIRNSLYATVAEGTVAMNPTMLPFSEAGTDWFNYAMNPTMLPNAAESGSISIIASSPRALITKIAEASDLSVAMNSTMLPLQSGPNLSFSMNPTVFPLDVE
ncbi:MAG: hypothetical protein ACK2T3_14060 [Candidatus Promineifilaceae bacterium]